jgi:CheY-like chemotaxis protein
MTKVLIVEDTDEMRTLLKSYLERMLKLEVIEAVNGLEGIKLARLEQPDVIILDLMMPVAGGDLALGFLRSTPPLNNIPVIVSSAHPNAQRIAQQLGAAACLKKPYDLFTLREAIEKALISSGHTSTESVAPSGK